MDFKAWVEDSLTIVQKHGKEVDCTCPKCWNDKLAVNTHRKAWQCWRCGFAGWQPTRLIQATENCSPARAEQIVASYAVGARRIRHIQGLQANQTEYRVGPPPAAPMPVRTTLGLHGIAAEYAARRGIPPEFAHMLGLSSVSGSGQGRLIDRMTVGRLLFPIWLEDQAVFWVARATDDSEIKTINLPEACNRTTHKNGPPCRGTPDCTCAHERWGLHPVSQCAGKSEALVGYHLLRPGSTAFLVEGPTDVAMCGPQFVGTMGATLSIDQAQLLAASGVSDVVILFDGDEAGRKGAEKAYALLSMIMPTRVAELPWGSDPGALGRQKCLAYAQRAPTGYSIQSLIDQQVATEKIARNPLLWTSGVKGLE